MTTVTSGRQPTVTLTRFVPLAVVLAVSAAVYPMLVPLRVLWVDLQDAGYGHGPLLAAVVAWLIVRASSAEDRPHNGSPWACAALVFVSIAWAAAAVSSTTSAAQALWPLMCWLVLAAAYGWRSARRFALPLGLLYFALPVWGPLTDLVLWPLTIKASSLGVQLLGLNAYVDRNFVYIPSGAFEIISGCSGQHFFLVATVIGLLIAYLNELRGRQFVLVVGVAVVLAMVMNWVRVTAIIAVGYATEMQHPIVAEGHLLFGWILFAAVLVLYILWARYYLGRLPALAAERPPVAAHHAAASPRRSGALLALGLVAALVGPLWYAAAQARVAAVAQLPVRLRMPSTAVSWIGPLAGESPLQPEFPAVALERRAIYQSADNASLAVHVYANLFVEQEQGAELVGYGNVVLPEADWTAGSVETFQSLATPSVVPRYRAYTALGHAGERWLFRQTYVIAGQQIASDWESKVALAVSLLRLRPPRAGLVLFAVACGADCEAVSSAMEQAWTAIVPGLLDNYQ